MARPIRASRLLQTTPGPIAPAGRAPRSRRGAPWGESRGGESQGPLTDALPKSQVPGVHRPHQGVHCMCPPSMLRGALLTSREAFSSPRRTSPIPRGAQIAPRGASSTSLHHPLPGVHCLLPGVHPPCPRSHRPAPCRAGGFGVPLPLLLPQLSALLQAPGLLPSSLLSSCSSLENTRSTRGFPLVLPRPRCAQGSMRPCAPRVLGSLPTPTSAAATTVAQRHQPAHSEKRGEGTQTSPTPFCSPLTQTWAHRVAPIPRGLSSSRAHRRAGGSDPLPQPLSQIALRFFLRVPIWATDEPRDVTASPSTHQVQWWAGRGPVCCGLTRSRGSPEQAAATVSGSPACTNFLGTTQRLSQH